MPDSAPEAYKELAEWCCEADPAERPKNGKELYDIIDNLIEKFDDNVWNTIYYKKSISPLSSIEKESKYSSRLLPTENLTKLRNSYDVDSVPGMKTSKL